MENEKQNMSSIIPNTLTDIMLMKGEAGDKGDLHPSFELKYECPEGGNGVTGEARATGSEDGGDCSLS